jgi:hypothetical protein
LATLVLLVVQFANNTFFRRSNFRELFIGFDVGKFLKLFDFGSLLHIDLPDSALLDLLAQIGKGEAQQGEGSSAESDACPNLLRV